MLAPGRATDHPLPAADNGASACRNTGDHGPVRRNREKAGSDIEKTPGDEKRATLTLLFDHFTSYLLSSTNLLIVAL
jgi:hypothetical protein